MEFLTSSSRCVILRIEEFSDKFLPALDKHSSKNFGMLGKNSFLAGSWFLLVAGGDSSHFGTADTSDTQDMLWEEAWSGQ